MVEPEPFVLFFSERNQQSHSRTSTWNLQKEKQNLSKAITLLFISFELFNWACNCQHWCFVSFQYASTISSCFLFVIMLIKNWYLEFRFNIIFWYFCSLKLWWCVNKDELPLRIRIRFTSLSLAFGFLNFAITKSLMINFIYPLSIYVKQHYWTLYICLRNFAMLRMWAPSSTLATFEFIATLLFQYLLDLCFPLIHNLHQLLETRCSQASPWSRPLGHFARPLLVPSIR